MKSEVDKSTIKLSFIIKEALALQNKLEKQLQLLYDKHNEILAAQSRIAKQERFRELKPPQISAEAYLQIAQAKLLEAQTDDLRAEMKHRQKQRDVNPKSK